MDNLYFPICAVLINLLVVCVFFTKKRFKSDETKAYSYLIVIALLESLLACALVVIMNVYGVPSYVYNMHRLDYILILFWVWALFNYVLIVSVYNNKKIRKTIQKISIIANIAISVYLFFLKVNVINENGIIDTSGDAVNTLIIVLALYVLAILILVFKTLIKNFKNFRNAKNSTIPCYILINVKINK